MHSKTRFLIREVKENGIRHGFKKAIFYLTRPVLSIIKRNLFLTELMYGTIPNFIIKLFRFNAGLVKMPRSRELVKEVRYFLYSNIPGNFDLDGEKIARKDIFTYGGPNPKFICPTCQKSEWLSRIRQKNLFFPHSCPQAKKCKVLCSRQGDEMWTHLHQNFDFSLGCNPDLPAPKCLCIITPEWKKQFLNPRCDLWPLILRRQLAYVCQVDIAERPININWPDYDFLWVFDNGNNLKFSRPNLPIIMYGHDFWPLKEKGFQWVIDWLKPDIFLSAYPTQWKENFKMPSRTRVAFYPFFDSLFFSRPNLAEKELDLLVIGAAAFHSVYKYRLSLNKQIALLANDYKIEFSNLAGAGNVDREGSVFRKDSRSGAPIRFLNKWSEYLGAARYVIFGRMEYPVLVSKYYEALGSGAVPIFPEAPDLKYLGVEPFKHYIPLSEVEGNNEKLAYFLDNYDKYRHIAQNAIDWYKENSDRMIFNGFEDLVGEVAGNKFPKRLV